MKRFLTQGIFLGAVLTIFAVESDAQTGGEVVIPPEVGPGVIEKSLEQSRPVFAPPPEEKLPEIIIKDSRKLKDPGAGPSFFVKKIIVEGNTLIDDETLAPLVDVDDGMELTLGILSLMANEITALYATEGYFLTRAFVPQQEMTNGTVKIQVSEGKIGKVTIKGNKKYDSKDFLDRMKPVQKEKVLREQTLENTLLELNSMLGIKVRSILRPGELPGTSDLVLDVTESRRYLFSYDQDNFGSQYTGTNRFGLNGTVGNVLTLGDQFSTRWSTSDMVFDTYSPSYIIPVNYQGTKLRLAYTFSENELGRSLKNQASGGASHSYTWELSHLLSRARTSQMTIRGGMDFKFFENEKLSTASISSKENLQDIYFGFGGNFSDEYGGRTFYDIKLQLGLRLKDTYLRIPSRQSGNDNALTSNLSLTRIQKTNILNSYFTIKFNGQVADKRVLSPNQMSVGGMGTIRGYTLAAISGDMGYSSSIDYTIPFPKKIKLFKDFPTLDQILSLNIFVDSGRVFVRDKLSSETTDEDISSAGAGITLNIPKKENKYPGFSFAFSYGHPMPSAKLPGRGRGTIYLSGMTNY